MKDCRTFDCEKSIAQAAEQFKRIKQYVQGEAQEQDAYAVERRLFVESMRLSLYMMGAYFEKKQGGHRGQLLAMPDGTKARVCVMDGSKGLWTQARAELKGFTFILDLFHALEYLWKVAYVFHAENSPEADDFVRQRLLMLLEGKVGYVIGGMRQMLTKHRTLHKAQRRTILKTIDYYQSHRKSMRYDEYIAAGYPIGSGAVEAACRHLVKDRMEGSGMRWTVPGAEAVLQLRALYLNGDWNTYWQHHMQCEYVRRFDSAAA